MFGVALRFVVMVLLGIELWLLDRPGIPDWASGIVPSIIVIIAVAVAVVSEPRVRIRRALGVVVVALYVARLLYVDGTWVTGPSDLAWAGATVIEGAVVLAMLEIENWRWSIVPAIALVALAGYHVASGFTGGLMLERVLWLGQALALLGVHAGRRVSESDDAGRL